MNPEHYSSGGVLFSERFCRELQKWWAQLGRDGPVTAADLRPIAATEDRRPQGSQWDIYFLSKELVPASDIVFVDGLPVCIRANYRHLLAGRHIDFEDGCIWLKPNVSSRGEKTGS